MLVHDVAPPAPGEPAGPLSSRSEAASSPWGTSSVGTVVDGEESGVVDGDESVLVGADSWDAL